MRPSYLDPATGSYVIQMLVAGVLGTLYAVRGFFFGAPEPEDEQEDDAEEALADAPGPHESSDEPTDEGSSPAR